MKKIFLAAASLFLLAGCGAATLEGGTQTSETSIQKQPEELVVGVSLSTLNNPFFVSMKDGIEALGNENKTTIKFVDAQDDSAKQGNDIDDLIQQKVDILLINPVDSSAIVPSVEAANQANIPVIAIDRSSEQGTLLTTVASNNEAGGKMAAEYILEQLGEQAKVVVLEGVPGASATRERGKGFLDFAKEQLDILDQQTANFNRAEGLTVMENMLQANSDIQGVFAQNDEMALGAIEALGSRQGVIVVGFDGTEDGIKAVEAGKLSATIAQKPEEMGKLALQAAYDHFAGQTITSKIDSPLELIKK
ncbi:MAG: D-ribose ABC transporter substrate-binding protein [Enterococcus sp.]|nr:D-ribose ABC transporter substrate-binding protein [Enterococcus sp.]